MVTVCSGGREKNNAGSAATFDMVMNRLFRQRGMVLAGPRISSRFDRKYDA